MLPGGSLLIDNPGVREIQLFGSEESLERTFEDVAALAAECRFSDCTHRSEPGCAVLAAVVEGSLSEERLESFRALQRELRYLQVRQDESAQRAQKQKWRAIGNAGSAATADLRRDALDRRMRITRAELDRSSESRRAATWSSNSDARCRPVHARALI
jgi:hypothetical protein